MHSAQGVIATAAVSDISSHKYLPGTVPELMAGRDCFLIRQLAFCRGHNGKVRSIVWSPDDTKLVSGGMDGAVYEWRIKDLKREKENVLKVRRCADFLSW